MKLKKILLLSLFTILFVSCKKNSESKVYLGKDKDFEIEYLFEVDGVKMYRFTDSGRSHYFTNKGQTITSQNYQSGKQHYTNEENID